MADVIFSSWQGEVIDNRGKARDAYEAPKVKLPGEFEKGVPVSVNGTAMGPVELLNLVNEYGSRHGVGTIDIVENRLVG